MNLETRLRWFLLLTGLAASAYSAQPPAPNMRLILADDMGYSDLGCMGSEITAPGRIHREPVHLIDVLPTVAELSGAEAPADLPGVSIVPALKNKPILRNQDLFWEYGSGQAIRRGDLKLVTCNQKSWELYNLASDRSETRNLAAQMPELVEELEKSWNRWWLETTGAPCTGKKQK